MTQCGGQTPPYSWKWVVFAGCQSREVKIGMPARSAASAHADRTGMTASPSATARDPPGQKSFCGSTSSRPSPGANAGGLDISLLPSRMGLLPDVGGASQVSVDGAWSPGTE